VHPFPGKQVFQRSS